MTCTCTSSGSCRATRPARWPATPTRALDRPAEARGGARPWRRGGRSTPAGAGAGQPRRATLRAAARGGRAAGRRRAGWPTPWRRPRTCDLRGVMAVAPLGADPARAFAELQRGGRRRPRRPPGGRLDLGRHERRPRGCCGKWGDTPACRDGNPRIASAASVTSGRTGPVCQAPTTENDDARSRSSGWLGRCARRWCTSGSPRTTSVTTRYDDYDDDREQSARHEQPAASRAAGARGALCRRHAAAAAHAGRPRGPRRRGRRRSTASRRSTRAPTTRPRTSVRRSARAPPSS